MDETSRRQERWDTEKIRNFQSRRDKHLALALNHHKGVTPENQSENKNLKNLIDLKINYAHSIKALHKEICFTELNLPMITFQTIIRAVAYT